MADEKELFKQAMRGVRKIDAEARVEPARPKPRSQSSNPGTISQPPSVSQFGGPDQTSTPWVLKDSSISDDRLRQLASGRLAVDMALDLHGMIRDEAFAALAKCMEQAGSKNWRVLCIIHGRGLHSSQGKPVLKEAVYGWLENGPYASDVLAVIPKPGTAGGSCLVLLRRRR